MHLTISDIEQIAHKKGVPVYVVLDMAIQKELNNIKKQHHELSKTNHQPYARRTDTAKATFTGIKRKNL